MNTRGMAAVLLMAVVTASANPVRRSPDLEARRRSAIDRSMIRFGRSSPPEPSAADIREALLDNPVRRGNSFLRFGRSQPVAITNEDLISLFKSYENDYDSPIIKRGNNFLRLGRDPKFIRFGRSGEEEKGSYDQADVNYPQRKSRARDHFIRLGRDSEELNDSMEEEERRKRSTDAFCHDCQA